MDLARTVTGGYRRILFPGRGGVKLRLFVRLRFGDLLKSGDEVLL